MDISFIDRINPRGTEPANPCLRWQSGNAVNTLCIESGLCANVYDNEIPLEGVEEGICNVFGDDCTEWWTKPMTDEEFAQLLDVCYIH